MLGRGRGDRRVSGRYYGAEHEKTAQHPLHYVVGSLIGATKDRYIPLLAAQDDDDGGCEFGEDRFRMIELLTNGTPILLVDDTFTTGSRLQSAAAGAPSGELRSSRRLMHWPTLQPAPRS